jgi:hypothetical protein
MSISMQGIIRKMIVHGTTRVEGADGGVLSDGCSRALVRRAVTPRPVLNFLPHASELANSLSCSV